MRQKKLNGPLHHWGRRKRGRVGRMAIAIRPTIFFVDTGRLRVVGRRRLGSLTHPTQSNLNNEAGH